MNAGGEVFSHDNVNSIFNSFSDTYLRIFQTSFLTKRICSSLNIKPWLTQGIKTTCHNNNKIYQISKYSRNPGVTQYFKIYCKILTSTIEASKRKYYDQLIYNSNNRTKTIWNIVKTLMNKRGDVKKITSIHLNNELVKDPTIMANSFNSFFSTVVHSLSSESPDNEGMLKLLRKHTPETLRVN